MINFHPRHRLFTAFCLAALAASFSLPRAHAAYFPTTGERSNIAKLIADFEAIKAGSEVTDAEKAALAADISLLTTSTTKPSAATVDQLASDLASAFADGSLSSLEKAQVIADVDAIFNSAGLTTEEANQFISDVQAILVSSGINADDVKLIASDLAAITSDLQSSFIATNTVFALTQPPAAASATPTASTTVGRGRANLITSERADGSNTAHLALQTTGLLTGSYTVSATTASGGAPVTLGALTVTGDSAKRGVGTVVFGDGGATAFPAGFDPAGIASLTVADTSGVIQLTGATTDAVKESRLGNFGLTAGTAYPDVVGHVAFQTVQKHTRVKSHFLLTSHGLPVSATLTLKVNGVAVGEVPTDAKDRLVITKGSVVVPVRRNGKRHVTKSVGLPDGVDLATIENLELDDAQGQVVATAGLD